MSGDFDPPAFDAPAFDPQTFDARDVELPEIDTDRLIAFTQDLVRVPSVFDPDRGLDEEPAAQLVADLMRSFGWSPTIDIVAPGRPNVIAVVDGGRPGPTLMFEGHTDVVTEGDPAAWSVDPFGGEISDGRLWDAARPT